MTLSISTPTKDSCQKAALSYALGMFSGLWFLLGNRRDPFVRFHALQAIGYSLVILFVLTILRFVVMNPFVLGLLSSIRLTIILALIFLYLLPFLLLYSWIFLIWKAYRGERAKAPLVGSFIEQRLGV